MKLYTLFLLTALVFFSTDARAQVSNDTTLHLYVLIGQSNMAGRGVIADEFKNVSQERVLMLDKNNLWTLAKHPLHFDKPSAAGVGPGLSFGIALANNCKEKIGLIPCAIGGTSIDSWIPGGYDISTKTYPYDDALLRIKVAERTGKIEGVLWLQGESDSTPSKIMAYNVKLKELIARLRKEIGNSKLPFVIGQLGTFRPSYIEFNRELDKIPFIVPYCALASSEGLIDKGDSTHFDGASATLMGKRMAEEMLKLKKNGH